MIFVDTVIDIVYIFDVKRLPVACPSCTGRLNVERLHCEHCDTGVEGLFPLPPLASLSAGDHDFVVDFIKASGSLKDMAIILGVSYPTVRNRLDEIISKLRKANPTGKEPNK